MPLWICTNTDEPRCKRNADDHKFDLPTTGDTPVCDECGRPLFEVATRSFLRGKGPLVIVFVAVLAVATGGYFSWLAWSAPAKPVVNATPSLFDSSKTVVTTEKQDQGTESSNPTGPNGNTVTAVKPSDASTSGTPGVNTARPGTPGNPVNVNVNVNVAPGAASSPQPIQISARSGTRNLAIFVKNRAGKTLDEKVGAMEELVASRAMEAEFSVISRDDVSNAVSGFAEKGANVGKAGGAGADLDAILSNSTSALRLAQNLGADYVFIVTLTTYGQETKTFKGYGVETVNVESKMRVSYKILDKALGGAFAGDTVEATKTTRVDKNVGVEVDVINELLDDAATKLTASLKDKIDKNKIRPPADDSQVEFTVVCGIQGMTLPDVVKNDKGEFVLASTQCKFEAMNVTVELNGVVIGTAPGKFKVPKGMSKIRLTREGYKDWERTISVTEGQKLNVDLQMSDEGYARWLKTTAFLAELKAGEKLTDAQAEQVRGLATMLRNSYKRVDLKVDTDLKGVVQVQNSVW